MDAGHRRLNGPVYDMRTPHQRTRDLSDQEIFDACCSRDDSRDGTEGPVTSYYSWNVWTAGSPCQRMQHYGPSHQRWRRDALQPPEVPQPHYARDTCVHNPESGLRCASWKSRELLGSTASSQTSREQKHRYLKRLIDKNDVVCVQETHGKDGFLQALQVLQTQFRMFGTFMLDNAHAGGSGMFIRKNLLPDRAAVTHEVTYQGRDLAIKVQSGESLLVIINIHFAPGPSLRSSVKDCGACEPIGLVIPNYLVFSMATSSSASLRKGGSTSRTKRSQKVMQERRLSSVPSSPLRWK